MIILKLLIILKTVLNSVSLPELAQTYRQAKYYTISNLPSCICLYIIQSIFKLRIHG